MKFDVKCEVCTLVDNKGRRLCESCEEMVKRLIVIEKRVNGCTVHLAEVAAASDQPFGASVRGNNQ